jgi:hypothetical protein
VLATDQQFRIERHIVTHERPRTGTEAEVRRLIVTGPDPDGEGDALGQPGLEVEHGEEALVRPRQGVLLARRDVPELVEHALHPVEDRVMRDGHPALGGRGDRDGGQLLVGDQPPSAVENQIRLDLCHSAPPGKPGGARKTYFARHLPE